MKAPRHSVALLVLAISWAAFAQGPGQPTTRPSDDPSIAVGNSETDKPRIEHHDKSRIRDLKGVVRDDKENPVEGAIVKVKNLDTGKVISWRTGKDGAYLFHDLDINTSYELTVSRDGFDGPVTKKLSPYDTRKPATLDVQLQRTKSA